MRRLCAAALAALTAFSPVPSLAAAVRVPDLRLSLADPVLREIAASPPQAVVLDYDGTLADRGGPGGFSLPTPQPVLDRVVSLLKAGVPVGIATGRNLDLHTSGPQMMVWDPLLARIPAELRSQVFFSGRMGAEFVLFDADGRPVRVLESDWSDVEKAHLEGGIATAFAASGVSPEEAMVIHVPGQSNVAFAPGDQRAGDFAAALAGEFQRRGLPYPVQHHKNWVYMGKSDKGEGMRLLYAALRSRGHDVAPEGILYIGDEFRVPLNRPSGGDAAAALAFPAMRAVSVGDAGEERLPPNVTRLSVSGTAGTMAVLDAVLAGLAPRPRALSRAGRNLMVFVGGAAAGLALPWLWAHPIAAAAASAATLTLLAVPRIVKKFRLR